MEPILVKFFLECKEDEHMLSLIEETYCFTDQDEQQQILQLAHSIIEGEADDLPFEPLKLSRKQSILDELQTICLEEGVFYIRSFQTFRLGSYYKQLRDITEAAIDEYKMEQEYQNFIQTLRDYVDAKQPRIKKCILSMMVPLHYGSCAMCRNGKNEIHRQKICPGSSYVY